MTSTWGREQAKSNGSFIGSNFRPCIQRYDVNSSLLDVYHCVSTSSWISFCDFLSLVWPSTGSDRFLQSQSCCRFKYAIHLCSSGENRGSQVWSLSQPRIDAVKLVYSLLVDKENFSKVVLPLFKFKDEKAEIQKIVSAS